MRGNNTTPPIHVGLAQHPIKAGRGRGLAHNVDVDVDGAGDDTDDDDWRGSKCDSKDEAEFGFVNPLVDEMFVYMQ